MATIKSFTSLEQSKVLAEFLSHESADMKWFFWKGEINAPKVPTFGYSKTAAESYKDTEAVYFPCWSLASLLCVLPRIEGLKPVLDLEMNYIQYPSDIDLSATADNPVDACVAMIEKLNEQKLL